MAFTLVDLPAPKRAANGTALPRALPGQSDELSAVAPDMTLDAELPALLGELDLGEGFEAALAVPAGDAARPLLSPAPIMLTLDLTDLPAPLGPRPRSRLSTRAAADEAIVRRRRASSPHLVNDTAASWLAAAKASQPADSEPAALPAPPARDPLLAMATTMPPTGASAAAADRQDGARSEPPLARPPVIDVLPAPGERSTGKNPTVPAARDLAMRPTEPLPRRASQPALPLLNVSKPAPPQRASQPALPVFPISKPAPPQRASQPALPVVAISKSAPPLPPAPAAVSPTPDGKKPEVALLPLPSDESGGARPASTSVSDPSGLSVITGAPPLSSRGTPDAKPVRLGYLISGLALLAILLAVLIARIATVWHKQSTSTSDPAKPPALEPPPAGSLPAP